MERHTQIILGVLQNHGAIVIEFDTEDWPYVVSFDMQPICRVEPWVLTTLSDLGMITQDHSEDKPFSELWVITTEGLDYQCN